MKEGTTRLRYEKFNVCFAHMGIFKGWKYQNQKILSLTLPPPKTIPNNFQNTILIYANKKAI